MHEKKAKCVSLIPKRFLLEDRRPETLSVAEGEGTL